MKSRGFASNYRAGLIAAAVMLSFLGVALRLLDLHVWHRDHYISLIEKVRRRVDIEHGRRGDILDAHGDILATSRTLIELGVDPESLRDEDRENWPELARLIGMNEQDLLDAFAHKTRVVKNEEGQTEERPVRWVKLSDTVEESTYVDILALGIKGVYGNRTYRRAYPQNSLAAHVIGYINKEDTPSGGVESFADFYLRAQDGWCESEKDGLRRELAQFRTRQVPATDGYSVVLSLDSVVQHMVDEELAHIAEVFKPSKASIIVSEPQTGFILAMGNYPTFDLNNYADTPLENQRNFSVTDLIDPGSTFKIVAASGALNDHLVTPDTTFDCTLTSALYKGQVRKFMPDDHHFDHPLSVSEIISHSSNIGAAQLGMLLGEERLYAYARAFGFAGKTGFPLGYEENGLLAKPEEWRGTDITRIPAGYSISATPIQIHYAMACLANDGVLMKPSIIREVRDPSGRTVFRLAPAERRRVVSTQVARTMARMLEKVASREGTAKTAEIPGFEVAGKTGTAQIIVDGRYSNRNHVGSFVGFFPASHPRVVISVVVDDGHPANGGVAYGSVVAAPSFKRLGEKLIQYLDIKPPTEVGGNLLVMEGGR